MRVERDLKKIARQFDAEISQPDFLQFTHMQEKAETMEPEKLKQIMGLKRKPSSPLFKKPGPDDRIYPGYFAPVIVLEKGRRKIKPMRYRVRPHHSMQEIPSKYNVFNARLDSLENRKTWRDIFLKNHALFPFQSFFEWVEKDGKKQLIQFLPDKRDLMWAPALYDHWQSAEEGIEFSSFALITIDPPSEVLAQGHDRCPLFLKEERIDDWLNVSILDKKTAYQVLEDIETTKFGHQFELL